VVFGLERAWRAAYAGLAGLLPKVLESVRRQFAVANGVLNVAVPEISLQRAGKPCREALQAPGNLLKVLSNSTQFVDSS
jgi:hypothetical protein